MATPIIEPVSATPEYSDNCPNLSPELLAVLSATTQALLSKICEGDQGQAAFTNAQAQALQDQIDLLSGATDLEALTATINAIRNLVDPDGDGTLDQLFAPLQAAIDNAEEAATAAQSAATAAQQTATAAATAATEAMQTANLAGQTAQAAGNFAQTVKNDVSALETRVDAVVNDVNSGLADLQAAHCAEKVVIQTALQEFVNVTLPGLLAAPCEMPAPAVGGGSGGSSSSGASDPSELIP